LDIVIPAIRAWAEAWFAGEPDKKTLVSAWYGVREQWKGGRNRQASVSGAASAYFAALERVGWGSEAPHTVTTIDGSVIDLMETAPKMVRKWAEDDWAVAEAAKSTIAANMEDLKGGRGYGIGLDATTGENILLGQCSQAARLREEALGNSRLKVEGRLVPWFEPLRIMVKAGKRTKEGLGEGLRSAIALAEGGWRTQLHLCASGLAAHPYCTACGPLSVEPKEEDGGEEEGYQGWVEGVDWGMRQEWEHIDWGGNKEAELQAGCKVGTIIHRLALCDSLQEEHGGEAARKAVREIRDGYFACPWDPLWWVGVAAVPAIAQAPDFEEYVERKDTKVNLIAQGHVYTDGACKGFFRRTRRAGWGACVLSEEGEILWGVYGTCPDAYASALRAELWGVLGILKYALPPLRISTDNAEVIHEWECGELYSCSPAREGADIWKKIWAKVRDIGKEGIQVVKVKAHLKKEEIIRGRISHKDWKGNGEADSLANKGARKAAQLAPNGDCDAQ
jgi:ribonuclease HI